MVYSHDARARKHTHTPMLAKQVLLLDEPSTGLDSGLANEVMIIVRDLARAGRVVVATVHSPTALIYSLFDDLYLLQGGKTIYNGPREGCKPYMEGLGYTFPADGRYSVVEWLVEITAGSSSTALQEARAMQSSEVATVNAGGGGGGGGGDDAEAPQPSSATEINSGFDFVAAWSECSENPYRHLNGGASTRTCPHSPCTENAWMCVCGCIHACVWS